MRSRLSLVHEILSHRLGGFDVGAEVGCRYRSLMGQYAMPAK
ncbi:hypothetical protein AB0H60_10520 [Nocardia rhamnosiphila]|nr:hypothetical protein [Nocardia zapadnayensis]